MRPSGYRSRLRQRRVTERPRHTALLAALGGCVLAGVAAWLHSLAKKERSKEETRLRSLDYRRALGVAAIDGSCERDGASQREDHRGEAAEKPAVARAAAPRDQPFISSSAPVAPLRQVKLRVVVGTLGELLLTVGLVTLLFVGYLLWGTSLYTDRTQHMLHDELRQAWLAPTSSPSRPVPTVTARPVPLGTGVAVIRIPRLGRNFAKVVVEGIDLTDLRKGPGHYPGTALPGQLGNAVISGHRTTYGAPFNRLDELRPGDVIVLETRDSWTVYRMSAKEIVAPTDLQEINPVPHADANAVPTQRLLTLTTCTPKYSAIQRLIVHATFVRTLPKAQGAPVELTAG